MCIRDSHEDGRCELYHLETDPAEINNVSDQNPQLKEVLFADLMQWLQQTKARMPFPNPGFDAEAYKMEKRRTQEVVLPRLERQHADFLRPDWSPSGGWWEQTGN